MELSVFYCHVTEAAKQMQTPVETLFPRLRDRGYTQFEVDFSELQADPALAHRLQEEGFSVSSMPCFFDFASAPQTERVHALVETAVKAGIRKIMPIPGFLQQDPALHDAQLQRMLAGTACLMEEAARAGLLVSMEDFDNLQSPIRDSAHLFDFLNAFPSLQVTFDTGNFCFAGEDVLSAFDALRGRIAHVHLKDRCDAPRYGKNCQHTVSGASLYPCPVGKGFLPMKKILRLLQESGYDASLTVEHFGVDAQWDSLCASAAFVWENWK